MSSDRLLKCVRVCACVPQRMQLDIILTSLQDHTHVASLLSYSCPADGPEALSSGLGFTAAQEPPYGSAVSHPDTHLAEILMKTLLRNLGFYTVRHCATVLSTRSSHARMQWGAVSMLTQVYVVLCG